MCFTRLVQVCIRARIHTQASWLQTTGGCAGDFLGEKASWMKARPREAESKRAPVRYSQIREAKSYQ